jgi:hypothetical protein
VACCLRVLLLLLLIDMAEHEVEEGK